MRRAVPLVIIAEDYYRFNGAIAVQFGIDAVFARYDMSHPATHKVALVKPFTSVTVIINEDHCSMRGLILNAAEVSAGALRVVIAAKGTTPELLAGTYQVKVQVAAASGGAPQPQQQPQYELVRFAALINSSERVCDANAAADSENILDLIRFCDFSVDQVPRDVLYFATVNRLVRYVDGGGSLWLGRSFRSSMEAMAELARSLRLGATQDLNEILRSKYTGAEKSWSIALQLAAVLAVVATSAGLTLFAGVA